MLSIKANGNEYKVKFGYNSFCDSDLLDRVIGIAEMMGDSENATGQIKDLFTTVRELLFVGFKKFNPVETVQEVGDILDAYSDEAEDGEDRSLMAIFGMISEELASEGFLASLLNVDEKDNKVQKLKK